MVVCSTGPRGACLRSWVLEQPTSGWSLQGALPVKMGMDVWEMLHPKTCQGETC